MTQTRYVSAGARRLFFAASLLALLGAAMSPAAFADIRADVARCAAIVGETARLTCFDRAAADMQIERNAAADTATAALAQEFRFDPNKISGPLALKIEVSGNLQLSRDTFAAREVEDAMRRITTALGGIEDWSLAITVHGGKVSLSRGSPYSGQELLTQAQTGAERSGLPEDRYTITRGPDAEPELWDDGRVQSANEHINIVVTGLGSVAKR